MMPVEAMSLIGAIGGIAEITKSAFSDNDGPSTAPRSTPARSRGSVPPTS